MENISMGSEHIDDKEKRAARWKKIVNGENRMRRVVGRYSKKNYPKDRELAMLSALAYTAAYIQILRNNESMPGETTYMEEADVLEAAMYHALHDGVWSDVSNFLLDQAQLYGTIGDLLEESEQDKREHRNIVTALDRLMELLPQT